MLLDLKRVNPQRRMNGMELSVLLSLLVYGFSLKKEKPLKKRSSLNPGFALSGQKKYLRVKGST
ncbi:hypothetical protein NPIL_541941, partial [Nephila pilipes]